MRDLRHTNPYEVGLTAGFDWDKDFIGKEALAAIRDNGAEREVVGFTVAEKDIHIKGRNMGNEGEKVFLDGEEIGRVMKITYSYVLDTNNGTIICKRACSIRATRSCCTGMKQSSARRSSSDIQRPPEAASGGQAIRKRERL